MSSANYQRVILHPSRDVSLRRGHPWLFSGAVAKVEGKPNPGDLVSVHTSDGETLGYGHWSVSSIAVKILEFGSQPFDEAKFIQQAIAAAYARRRAIGLLDSTDTDGYRLVHAEGDKLPGLIIDVFSTSCVIQFQSEGMLRLRDEIVAALREVLGSKLQCIYQKAFDLGEKRGEVEGQYLFGQASLRNFRENGMTFLVDWERGQKTGFFLDQRENRALVQKMARGKSVLNCFSYSGGFSVAALAGGAHSVLSVDSSRAALALCAENVTLNFPAANHKCQEADCLQFLHTIPPDYDLIVLDPPAFIKHRGAFKGGLKGYETINFLAMQAARPHSLLFTFSCSQLLSKEDFWELLTRSAARAGREARVLQYLRQAPCHPVPLTHPESDYLKGFVLEIS
ncbi:MAG: class I SAM-dependent rRNA methyltransferase [Oligoflexia bacterium]|nr:class I SAM-dependent rRNA methyltransferase [Oligoflexia bacterium]